MLLHTTGRTKRVCDHIVLLEKDFKGEKEEEEEVKSVAATQKLEKKQKRKRRKDGKKHEEKKEEEEEEGEEEELVIKSIERKPTERNGCVDSKFRVYYYKIWQLVMWG